jgi:hypothetical protein
VAIISAYHVGRDRLAHRFVQALRGWEGIVEPDLLARPYEVR